MLAFFLCSSLGSALTPSPQFAGVDSLVCTEMYDVAIYKFCTLALFFFVKCLVFRFKFYIFHCDKDFLLYFTFFLVFLGIRMEHIPEAQVAELTRNIFLHIRSRIAVITTPNKDYNVLFNMTPGTSHRFFFLIYEFFLFF